MNSSNSANPRFICRVVRACNAILGTRNAGHLDACADCRAYFSTVQDLDAALRTDSRRISRESPEPSTGFERRIIHAVREADAEGAAARRETRSPWTRGLALASVAAVAALVFTRTNWLGPRDDSALVARETAAVLVSAVESASSQFTDTVIPSAGQLVAQNPLQDELGSVYADVRHAIDFLALNFLPSGQLPTSPEAPSTRRI